MASSLSIDDKAAGTDVVRSQAQRAGADIVEVEGSHVIMVSQLQAVTDRILKAAAPSPVHTGSARAWVALMKRLG